MSFEEIWLHVEHYIALPAVWLSMLLGTVGADRAGWAVSVPVFIAIVGDRLRRLCPEDQSLLLWPPRGIGLILWVTGLLGCGVAVFLPALAWVALPLIGDLYDPSALHLWWQSVCAYWRFPLYGTSAGVVAGLVGFFAVGRWVEPWFSDRLHGVTRAKRADGLTDARHVLTQLPRARPFDPAKYFSIAHKKDAMFLGLDEDNKPVLLPRAMWKKNHVQIQGGTGTGKGVLACGTLTQAISYGDAVVVIDPKDDEWARHVLYSACRKAGVPFHLLDLRDTTPRVNLLARATVAETNELLIAGFSLSRTGESSDFYRTDDRRGARALASLATAGPVCLASLSDCAGKVLGDTLSKSARGLLGQLEEVAALPVTQTLGGFDLASVLNEGGCLFVLGSIRDEA
ncbi:MAG: hypothetical protein ACRETW_02905, partial [Stenotrophobium sp.]